MSCAGGRLIWLLVRWWFGWSVRGWAAMAAARAAAGRWPAPCISPAPPPPAGWRGGWPAGPALPGVTLALRPWECCGLGRPLGLAGALVLTVGPGLGRLCGLVGLTTPSALLGRSGSGRRLPGGPRAPRGVLLGMAGAGRCVWLCRGLGRPWGLAAALALVLVGPGLGRLCGLVGLTGVAALLGRWSVGLRLRWGPWAPRG